ncbi:MAG: nucleotidyltransferase family protein [Flavobacteriales bacterium]|nr:nucleotidyltransferase family protein [Flavobacteriales bacterium]MEB2342228.1 nucleotidyl transferase AbiEii/AbiGii toxin family protein [Flavobacteriia bacterium]
MTPFGKEVSGFLRAAHKNDLRVLLVGGGAVNFHGYQRHSADIDLWIEPSGENFDRLLTVLRSLGYTVDHLPDAVLRQEQNISIKISPEMEIELITRFTPGCTFEEAWARSEVSELAGEPVALFRVLSYDDLIASKLRSARPKDLLDVQELKRKRR